MINIYKCYRNLINTASFQKIIFIINIYNSLSMQKTQNLFYRWETLQNVGNFLSLKDLLRTATLSKQYNFLLKKYLKQNYSLTNNGNQSEFKQLQTLFNRKLYVYNKKSEHAKANPSNIILRNIQCQEKYSVVQTIDGEFKLTKTDNILLGHEVELIPLPKKYSAVRMTEGNILYCSSQSTIHKYNLSAQLFPEPDLLKTNGVVQNIITCSKYTIALIRSKPDDLKIKIFDNTVNLSQGYNVNLPFQIISLPVCDNLVVGKNYCYFIYNQTLYQLNLKSGNVVEHTQFFGKKIVKIMGGKLHFMAYERAQELAINWTNEDVIKFAQREGFLDQIQIFKAEKVTGKILIQMDKKYMQQVLGIINFKIQQKIAIKLAESNKQKPENYVLYGWGRASEGALGTNPSKQITKPIKIKLPADCQILSLKGLYTFIVNKATGATLINNIDEKTNKQEWKEITKKKIWSVSVVDDSIILNAAVTKQKVEQRQTQNIVVEKKQKLRTVKNIIDKITWDPSLNSQQFTVGYLDKEHGVLQLNWKQFELETEIKEYRIQYFKRGTEIVWDKKKRIDIL